MYASNLIRLLYLCAFNLMFPLPRPISLDLLLLLKKSVLWRCKWPTASNYGIKLRESSAVLVVAIFSFLTFLSRIHKNTGKGFYYTTANVHLYMYIDIYLSIYVYTNVCIGTNNSASAVFIMLMLMLIIERISSKFNVFV